MHTIKACVVICIDFRFQSHVQNFLAKEGLLGNVDIISIAGAAHDFSTPANQQSYDYVMTQIGASISLHHPDKVILIDHQDCGMYNLTGEIPHGLALETDIEKHHYYLQMAKQRIQDSFNQIDVELVFMGLDGNFTKLP